MDKVMHCYALLTQTDRIILRSASNFFLSGGKEKKTSIRLGWREKTSSHSLLSHHESLAVLLAFSVRLIFLVMSL